MRSVAGRLRPIATRLRPLVEKIAHPHPVAAALLIAVSAVAVALILANGQGGTALAVPVYMVACYATALLVKGCIWAAGKARAALMRHELSRRYVTDMEFRTGVEVHVLLVVDGLYGTFLVVEGVALGSFWFGATGIYYLILTALHVVLVRSLYTPRALRKRFAEGVREDGAGKGGRAAGERADAQVGGGNSAGLRPDGRDGAHRRRGRLRGLAECVGEAMSLSSATDELTCDVETLVPAAFDRELRAFRLCAVLLLVLDVAFTGVVAQMVRDGRGSAYPGHLIYVAALFAFYSIAIAIMNLARSRKYDRPMVWATKALDLSTGLVSILSLQTAMFASFGEGQVELRNIMNGLTGLFVCAAIAIIAVVMLIKAWRLEHTR